MNDTIERHMQNWRALADRLAAERVFRSDAANGLLTAIIRVSKDDKLVALARSALLSLTRPPCGKTDRFQIGVSKRRFDQVRHHLCQVMSPTFGKRAREQNQEGKSDPDTTFITRCRLLLNLPIEGDLHDKTIRQAFRRTVFSVHPDSGGNQIDFLAVVAARNRLLAASSGHLPEPTHTRTSAFISATQSPSRSPLRCGRSDPY